MAIKTYLYDVDGKDRTVEPTRETLEELGPKQLLWIDADSRDRKLIRPVAEQLGLKPGTLRLLIEPLESRLESRSDYTHFCVETAPATLAEEDRSADSPNGSTRLDFLISRRWILTVHDGRIGFIDEFRERDEAEKTIGALTTYDFAASLLDAHLEAYFAEIARIEATVDRLDEQALLKPSSRSLLGRMVAVRRRVSRLRARLSAQRPVFYALSRPDLQADAENGAPAHFEVLVNRFERAIDEVEHTRDLVVGSFDLFASRAAQETNDLVQVLTYLTAIVGVCAAIAGVFGMNFETGFFASGDTGFYLTIALLVGLIPISAGIARWRGWI